MFCVLQEAPQLALDDELANLLNQAPGKCLQYVVIEGNPMHLKWLFVMAHHQSPGWSITSLSLFLISLQV